ncbi:MAG: ion transporter, partial [Nitrospirae bacterium]|nr:ion transporter [Nitrospirota bacterium]
MTLDQDKKHHRYEKTRVFLHEVIFEADTPLGKAFDILLLISILLSVLAVMLDSVESINADYGIFLYKVEWFFTIIFTIEYCLRLLCVGRPFRYATSFFGVVDLLAIVPTYLSILMPGSQYFLIIRVLRVLRVFRILKIVQYVGEANVLMEAMRASKRKIIIFLFAILNIVTILGSVMYLIEGKAHGFTSIPEGIYWAIVTLTTVGYGDIAPGTPFGKAVGSFIMILGYGIIAVPT